MRRGPEKAFSPQPAVGAGSHGFHPQTVRRPLDLDVCWLGSIPWLIPLALCEPLSFPSKPQQQSGNPKGLGPHLGQDGSLRIG